jgi:hypothetical protein
MLKHLCTAAIAMALLTACSSSGSAPSQSIAGAQPRNTDASVPGVVAVSTGTIELTAMTTQPQGTATGLPTSIASARPTTAVEATRAAFDTRVAEHYSGLAMQYAFDTPPPVPRLGTPEPSPTWVMGMQGCTNLPGYYPQMYGCWRGVINGELTGISGGRQGTEGDRTQGLLMIFHGPLFDPTASTTEVYSTPLKIGGVHLVSVDGTRVTLVRYDFPGVLYTPTTVPSLTPSVVFVFDLATRRWVNP